MKSIVSFSVIVAVLALFLACSSCGYLLQDYEKIADKITEKTAKKLKEEKKLCLVGTGGKMMHDIQAMDMSFNYYTEVDLQTARELVVYAIDEYLKAINDNREIRPYLHEYPFTAKNVEIRIWIYKPDGSHPHLDNIQCICSIDGIITYYLDAPEQYTYKLFHKETYEEAFKLVKTKAG